METKVKKYSTLAGGLLIMLCVGILYMWSVFQPHVVAHYGWESGQVAMTSALMIAFFVAGNIISGLIQEKMPSRVITLGGCLLFSLGMLLTANLSGDKPWMIYITYSAISGFGCGVAYCTVLSCLQKWFPTKNGLITGLTVSFFGLSVVLLSPITQTLLSNVGVPATFKTLATAFLFVTCISSMSITKPSSEYYMKEASKILRADEFKQFTAPEMLKTPMYYQITAALFLSSAAYMVLVPYITTIALSRGMSSNMALVAVMVTGIANALGRILGPAVSDKIGRTKTVMVCSLITVAACIMMIFAKDVMYIVTVFLIAFSYGGCSGVNPVMATELFGAKNSGTNYGFVLIALAACSIVFGKIAASVGGGDFTTVFIACAAACLIPIALMQSMHNFCKKHGKII